MAVRPPEVVETCGAYRFATIGAIRCVVFVEPGSQETYWLLRDVCAIPSDVGLRLELVNVCAIPSDIGLHLELVNVCAIPSDVGLRLELVNVCVIPSDVGLRLELVNVCSIPSDVGLHLELVNVCAIPSDVGLRLELVNVCAIPSDVGLRLELVNVSRAVCRFACSNIHDNQCSGFLYSRPGRLCTLSPYTGERLPSAPLVCDPTNEFYRRSRLLSKLQCDVSHTSLALLCSPG